MSGLQSIKGFDYQLDVTLLLIFDCIINKDFSKAYLEVRKFNKNNMDDYDIDLILESPGKILRVIEIKSGKYYISDIKNCFEAVIENYQNNGYDRKNIFTFLVIPHKKIKVNLYPCEVLFLSSYFNDSFFESKTKNHIHFEIINIFCELFAEIGLPRDFLKGTDLLKNYSFILRSRIDKFAHDTNLRVQNRCEEYTQHKVTLDLDSLLTIEGGFCDFVIANFQKRYSTYDDILNKLKGSMYNVQVPVGGSITEEYDEIK